jgi:hypothetical protein
MSSKAAITNFVDGFMGLSDLCCFDRVNFCALSAFQATFLLVPNPGRVRSRNDLRT